MVSLTFFCRHVDICVQFYDEFFCRISFVDLFSDFFGDFFGNFYVDFFPAFLLSFYYFLTKIFVESYATFVDLTE